MTAVWAQDNNDWVPQACWAWKSLPSYMRVTNLRSVGYKDPVGTCGAVDDGEDVQVSEEGGGGKFGAGRRRGKAGDQAFMASTIRRAWKWHSLLRGGAMAAALVHMVVELSSGRPAAGAWAVGC